MKNKKMIIRAKDVLKKIRKPVPKPSAIHKMGTRYNRKKSKIIIKKISRGIGGIEDEENNT